MTFRFDLNKLSENRLKNLERKKKLLERVSSTSDKSERVTGSSKSKGKGKKRKTATSNDLTRKPRVSPLPASIKSKACLPQIRWINSEHPVYPSDSLEALIELCRNASKYKSRHIAFCWPVSPIDSGVIHALATMQNQANGDKYGIRSIVYPCKSNIFHSLNHLTWDTHDLLKIIRRNAEAHSGENSWIINSHRDKDPFLFSVTELERIGEVNLRPTFTDLMPHFYSENSFRGWEDCSDQLLGNILARTRRRNTTRSFKKTAADVMGQPTSAPDAIFAIDGRLSNVEINQAISELYSYKVLPDLLLINWPLKARIDTPNWLALTKKLISNLYSVAGGNCPGIVCIADDPCVSLQLQHELNKLINEQHSNPFELHAIACSSGAQSLIEKNSPNAKLKHINFTLQLIDSQSARLCQEIYRIEKINGLDTPDHRPLAKVIGLLSRISSLPCGLKDIEELFNEGEISERSAYFYRWLDLKTTLQEQFKASPISVDASQLCLSFEKVSEVMGQSYEATKFALRLAKLVSVASASKPILLVFETEFRRKVAQKFLSRFTDFPHEIRYDDISSHIEFTMLHELENNLAARQNAHVIFVGLNTESTRIIMCSNRLPQQTTILCPVRSAMFLRNTLITIQNNFAGNFRPFRSRIKSLIDQIPEETGVTPFFTSFGYQMPDLRLDLSDSLVAGQDLTSHPEAWAIQVENNKTIRRLPEQRVFVYDPYCSDCNDNGFKEKEVRKLKVGERIFVLSAELKWELDELLCKYNINFNVDSELFEQHLRKYHTRIQELLNENYPKSKIAQQVSALRSRIIENYPQHSKHFPQEPAMKYWVNSSAHLELEFEESRPFAPAREDYFKAFAVTLGMSEIEAAVFWSTVIQPLRLARRLGGKKISDGYSTLFLEPEQLISLENITQREIELLVTHARDNTFAIEDIKKGQLKND